MQRDDTDIIAALYDGIIDQARLEAGIVALMQRFDGSAATIVSFDPSTPATDITLGVGAFDRTALRRYTSEFAKLDPLPPAVVRMGPGSAFASDRLFSTAMRRKNVMLNEFLRPLGLEETLGGSLFAEDGRFALLGVVRGADRPAFSSAELEAMGQLLPHVRRALELRRAFERLGAQASALTATVDRLLAGVIVTGEGDAALHVNRAAREMAMRQDGFALDRRGIPHAASTDIDRRLEALRRDAAQGGSGGIVRLPRRGGGPPYAVLVAPLPAGTGFDGTSPRASVLVLVHDPDSAVPDAPDVVARAFGLPPATARLVAALANGEEPKDYAERSRITYDTVRHHLKIAFSRTGVRSQSRLLQLVARAIAELGRRH